jgi:hypothetical protein
VLFLVAVALFYFGIRAVWRVLCQLRLKGLLILVGTAFLLLNVVSILTASVPLPVHKQVWLTMQRLFSSSTRWIGDAGRSLIQIPEEFRFAYTGHRRPLTLGDIDPEDILHLTPIPAPIPANRPAEIAATTQPTFRPTDPTPSTPAQSQEGAPTPSMTPTTPAAGPALSDCPHPQARLTAPRSNQVIVDEIQVEGAASIEDFDYYKFEIRREDVPVEDEWHWLASYETPVENGILGLLHVGTLPEGIYTLRLTVVNREGNYPFPPCDVRVRLAH